MRLESMLEVVRADTHAIDYGTYIVALLWGGDWDVDIARVMNQ